MSVLSDRRWWAEKKDNEIHMHLLLGWTLLLAYPNRLGVAGFVLIQLDTAVTL